MDVSLYLAIARQIADTQSGCLRRKVGALAIGNNSQIISSGYNSAMDVYGKTKSCVECLRQKLDIPSGQRHEICNALHAEQMVICNAADRGISLRNSTLIVTCSPCIICAKMIVAVGFKQVYYESNYPDDTAIQLLRDAGVRTIKAEHVLKMS